MKKCIKRVLLCVLAAAVIQCAGLLSDRDLLNKQLIRLHVVADSDSPEAQALKLQVRDAVIESLENAMADIKDAQQAKAYLSENLPRIQAAANQVLKEQGSSDTAIVSLRQERFDTRHYDTFSLPAGIYEALRITIGKGAGQNWWCVVFPTLCVPAAAEGFEAVAAGAGFPEELTQALEGNCELRFFLLDALGQIENILWRG